MPLGLFKFRNGSAKSGDRHIVNSAEMEAIFPESHSSQKLLQSPDPIEDGMYNSFHENLLFSSVTQTCLCHGNKDCFLK